MGTASTMACLLVGLGMMPLNGATAPAVSAARLRIAEETGRLAVASLLGDSSGTTNTSSHDNRREPLKPQMILSRASFLNAITVLQAIGGSTNAIIHLMAIVNRHPAISDPDGGEDPINLDTIDAVGRTTPLLVDLKPSGDNYMLDFHQAGGMPSLLHELRPLLHLEALTITGRSLGEELDIYIRRCPPIPYGLSDHNQQHCIHPLSDPIYPASSLVVLKGNLCPRGGAVMKASASKNRSLLKHTGPAVVFTSPADLASRIDDQDLPVTPQSVLVLQGIGPKGNPGMPESGLLPVPRKLARSVAEGGAGVADMLRVSDGRMSGTAGGSAVLHVSPEAADLESVLGIVRTGDLITCDVERRLLQVEISDDEIRSRQRERRQALEDMTPEERPEWYDPGKVRGYKGLFLREVLQAEDGCDFAFLRARGPDV